MAAPYRNPQFFSNSTSSSSTCNTFAQLATYPPHYGTCFSEIIPIHLNAEFFPNEIPLVLPVRVADARLASAVKRGRPAKPADEKSAERPKETAKDKKRAEYRQYWLSSVKLPIEDSLLHSRLGIRRLGPPPGSAKTVASPSLVWTAPGPADVAGTVASSGHRVDPDSAMFVYLFLQTFAPYMELPRYDITAFNKMLVSPELTAELSKTLIALYRFLEPELILNSDALIQQLDREEQQFLQTYGKNAYTSRVGLHHAVTKLKSDLLFFRHLFESAPVTGRTIWSLIVHAASFITGPAIVELKEDLFFAEDADGAAVELETSWVIDEALDYKDFCEASPDSRCRLVKNLIEKLLDTAIVKKILDINAEVRVRLQAEIVQLNKNEQRLSARILSAKRSLDGTGESKEDPEVLQKQLEVDMAYRARLASIRTAVERLLQIQPHSSEPIGQDRHGNQYFAYPFAPNTVVVLLKKQHTIGLFVGEKTLDKLIDSLDSRGIKEEALRRAVLAVKSEDDESLGQLAVPEMPEQELVELLGKDQAVKGAPEADDFGFLRQTLAVAREATRSSIDVWMGDTENVVETGDIDAIVNRLVELIPEVKSLVPAEILRKPEIASPEDFKDFVRAVSEKLIDDATERQVLLKIVGGRNAQVPGEDVECNYCGKRCVNTVLLDVHVKKWCKQKGASQEDGEEAAQATAATSWVEAVESVPMTFPSMSQAKQQAANVLNSAGPFVCEACSKEFGQQSVLSLHVRKWCKGAVAESPVKPKAAESEVISAEGPPFKCPHCKREMATYNGLTVHLGRWCPSKMYHSTTVDLTTGWSDEDEPNVTEKTQRPPESDMEIGTPAESVEDILLGGEVAKVPNSTGALALTWLLWRAQSQ